jgi:ABC-type phosphate transport system substrate-binding protein
MKPFHKLYRVTAIAAAIAAPTAIAATPVTPPTTVLYGGGATFPSEAYIGPSFLGIKTALPVANRLSQTVGVTAPTAPQTYSVADKGSLFGAIADALTFKKVGADSVGVTYCQTGSGTGKAVLNGTTAATGACNAYDVNPAGFSVPSGAADFAGSDEPMTQADVNAFNGSANAATRTQISQLPSTIGSIAIIYNNSDPVLNGGKKKINLTRSDICGIFSGTITNWNELTHTPKITLASKPIQLIVRSDSSGTTFNFMNFLTHACPALGGLPGDVTSNAFKMNKTFTSAFRTGFSVPSTIVDDPATSGNGWSGNGGVVTKVNATDGAIGYADIADATARAKLAGAKVQAATVSYGADLAKTALVIAPGTDGTCPAGTFGKLKVENGGTGLPGPITTVHNPSTTKTLKFSCPAVVYNKLDAAKNLLVKGQTAFALTTQADKVSTTSTSDATPRASLSDPTAATLPVAGCVQVVDPAAYAEPATAATKKAAADFAQYPIVALTYLLAYQNGNTTKTDALQTVIGAFYNFDLTAKTGFMAKTKTIGKTSGFAPLDVTLAGYADFDTYAADCLTD